MLAFDGDYRYLVKFTADRNGADSICHGCRIVKRPKERFLFACLALIMLGGSAEAANEGLVSNQIVVAVRHRDCAKAIKELNTQIQSKDGEIALFVAGRMFDEGICVEKDPDEATKYFARGTEIGGRAAMPDYATKIGLGEGEPQDYLRAGDLCHKLGMDPQGRLSFYSLGYACTVLGVAGKMLREDLPIGAFRTPTSPAIIRFNPVSGELRIVTAPKAERAEPVTGRYVGEPLVDTPRAIEKAWRAAMSAVPKPNSEQLLNQAVELPLDIDMTLEVARAVPPKENDSDRLLPGDRLHSGNTPLLP